MDTCYVDISINGKAKQITPGAQWSEKIGFNNPMANLISTKKKKRICHFKLQISRGTDGTFIEFLVKVTIKLIFVHFLVLIAFRVI